MTKIKEISNIIILLLLPLISMSQRFNFGATAGMTFSQVNGDELAGYDKLGLEAGVRTDIFFTDRWNGVVELLYSQRGSASEITFSGDNAVYALKLNYLSIPVMVELKDWLIEDGGDSYYRIRFQGGLAYGQLFQSEETFGTGIQFPDNDLSFVGGIGIYASRHWAFTLRYTRSIIPLDRVMVGPREVNVIPHHLTLSTQYMFF
ncbi:MAG: porin family protein [Saprospiraceae bacterium]|nr:porin family protein [Saprospiraceae bacterium]